MRFSALRSARISSIALRCAPVSENGSAASSRRPNAPSATCARPGVARMRARTEKERELVRQKLVIGEPGRGGAGRVDVLGLRGAVHRAERLREARQLQQAQRLFADPLREARQPLQRALGRARDRALKETLGQAVDRLDRRQAGELLRVHHPVGMDDLAPSVPELELAGNPARRADRQARAHPVMIGEKEHELDVAGLVLDQHLERRARARIRRLAMLGDPGLDGDDRVGNSVADFRPRAPVERGVGQVEQHVDDARALRP